MSWTGCRCPALPELQVEELGLRTAFSDRRKNTSPSPALINQRATGRKRGRKDDEDEDDESEWAGVKKRRKNSRSSQKKVNKVKANVATRDQVTCTNNCSDFDFRFDWQRKMINAELELQEVRVQLTHCR